jgi:aspartyl-tRNA(Asn)/glutamyl-tRNA(Gln) amidotransferase subunit B
MAKRCPGKKSSLCRPIRSFFFCPLVLVALSTLGGTPLHRLMSLRVAVTAGEIRGGALSTFALSCVISGMKLEPPIPSGRYEPVIGLEVHAQLRTITKAFCGCSTAYSAVPNTNTCPVCLGHPGTLPVLNREMVTCAIMLGLATGCTIRRESGFARKNYFYADLPKGYQITQYDDPICHGGHIDIDVADRSRKRVGLTRIHMEEDAGKSIHGIGTDTLVDFNRCGVPLLEIVSEPDLRSAQEAYAYLTLLRQIVTYLGICDGNMEEGSLRCDANISLRRIGEAAFGTRTELKNLNSFRNVERAIEYEIARQAAVLDAGGTVLQETMQWDAGRGVTVAMRGKEESHDYRYFPEPDLVPVRVDDAWIERARVAIPELPVARRDRFIRELGLPRYDAGVLTAEKPLADYFEEVVSALSPRSPEKIKAASNWVMGDVLRVLKEQRRELPDAPLAPETLAQLLDLISAGNISGKIAKDIFEELLGTDVMPSDLIARKDLAQISDASTLAPLVDAILAANMESVMKYLAGRENIFGFFVGQVMKRTGGQANPDVVTDLLKRALTAIREGGKG